jgi:drug/metabolite transporter (DMT)-like permease
VGLLALLWLRYGSDFARVVRSIGGLGLIVVVLNMASHQLFVYSVATGSAATTLVVLAAAPLIAGAVAWLVISERPPVRTWIAAVAALVGVAVMIGTPGGGVGLAAQAAAVGSAFGLAAQLTLMRRARAVDMVPAIAFGQLFIGLANLVAGPVDPGGAGQSTLMVVSGLVLIPVATMLFTAAPRYLPAAQVGLFLPLETVLGTALVWLVADESPQPGALLGGAIVLGALIWHASASLSDVEAEESGRVAA